MDIFQQACAELGLGEMSFDEDNNFFCELESLDDQQSPGLVITINKNVDEISLMLVVTVQRELPEQLSADFLVEFGERAIEPSRGGYGIGIFPNSKLLSLYQKVLLSDSVDGHLKNKFSDLVDAAEIWDKKLQIASEPKQVDSYSKTASIHKQDFIHTSGRGIIV